MVVGAAGKVSLNLASGRFLNGLDHAKNRPEVRFLKEFKRPFRKIIL